MAMFTSADTESKNWPLEIVSPLPHVFYCMYTSTRLRVSEALRTYARVVINI